MKRKHSICMGIAIVITLLYVVYLCWYLYSSYNDSLSNSNTLKAASVAIAGTLMLPHIGLCALAFIFLIVAFFSNMFAMALTSGILFSVSALAFLVYAPFLIPSITLTFIGSAFCFKRKKLLKEEEEERLYQQQKNVQPKQRRNTQAYSQRQIEHQDLGYQQGQQVFQQANQMSPYANGQMSAQPYGMPYANTMYAQDPYMPLDQAMVNEVYANPMMQNTMNQVPVQPMNFQPAFQQPQIPPQYPMNMQAQGFYQPNDAQVYQNQQNAYVAPTPMNVQANDGYFDDYGNFHFFNENNR